MSKVLVGIGAIVGNRDELGVFVSQYWSIPKRRPDSADGGLPKFIPEKLNGSDVLSSGQVYKFEGDDDDFRNCVIGESGVGGCVTPLCDMVGLWKVDDNCGIVNVEGVVWRCGFVTSVGYCDPMNADAFTVISWHCKLAMGWGTVVGWICGLATTVVVCGLVTAADAFTVISWHGKLAMGGGTVVGWICGVATVVVVCGLVTADVFTVICGLATTVVVNGLVTAVELVSVVGCGFVTEGSAVCGLGMVSRFGVITAWFFVASASEMDG